MNQDTIEDEVLSDSQSSMSSRRNSSISSHITNANIRPRGSSITKRRPSIIDTNEHKQLKQQIPAKTLVFTSKCSEIFKSTLEDCVEDCILEFPGENSIYVSKFGQVTQIPARNRQSSTLSWKEPNSDVHPPSRSQRRRSSITPFNLPQIGGVRTSQVSNISLSTSTAAARMRQQKFTFAEHISEEATDSLTKNNQIHNPPTTELDSEHPHMLHEDALSHQSNTDILSQSPLLPHRKLPSTPAYKPYRNRRTDYLLSDLVMLGPEYFAHVFNLPRTSRHSPQTPSTQSSNIQQRHNKTADKYKELDQIRQDLFHRYLWTQKPQVSCRIRPIPTYTRSTTFVI